MITLHPKIRSSALVMLHLLDFDADSDAGSELRIGVKRDDEVDSLNDMIQVRSSGCT